MRAARTEGEKERVVEDDCTEERTRQFKVHEGLELYLIDKNSNYSRILVKKG